MCSHSLLIVTTNHVVYMVCIYQLRNRSMIYSIKWPDLRSQWDSRTCQNKPPDPPIWGWKRMECCVGTQLWAVTTSWSSYVTAIYSQYVMNHIIGWKYLTRPGVSKPPSWLFVTAAAINFGSCAAENVGDLFGHTTAGILGSFVTVFAPANHI